VLAVLILLGVVVVFLSQRAHEAGQDQSVIQKPLEAEYTSDSKDVEAAQPDSGEPAPVLSQSVLALIDPETDYETRLAVMRQLGYSISQDDIDALMEFLSAEIPSSVKISRGAYNAVRNDLYEVLLRQKHLPEGLGSLLVDVVDNPDQDGMWRNYCIQFMPEFYERQSRESKADADADSGKSEDTANELSQVRDALWNSLEERDNSNAATALMGLERLSRSHAEIDRHSVEAAMLDLASDGDASVANRITAIRMCGEQGNTQALDVARDLAQNGDTTMLRCAAIATLGEIGTDEDLSLLEAYAASGDKRIQGIAQTSLYKLKPVEP
jgi:hypothetical protein